MSDTPESARGVRVRALQKSFHSFGVNRPVLKGIDVDVAPGEVVGLIGPNGAGKTTLMSCILGFLFPTAGEVSIDGLPGDDLSIRARTGFIPERMNFDRTANGASFLRYMARLSKIDEPERRADELLERLGLTEAADQRLSQYSRGMLQRLAMCQALIADPDFLFLDEPTSGLDPNGVMLVRDVIAEQRARGAAVLLNSHQLSEVEKVCDRVLFLSKGVIAQDERLRGKAQIGVLITLGEGSFDTATIEKELGVSMDGPRLHINVAEEREIGAVVRRVVGLGADVIEVRRQAVDLEQIFRSAK